METAKGYENYPIGIVFLSNFVSLAIYGLGLFIVFKLGLIYASFYLLYILMLEYRLISRHCVNCYYFGKTCGFGKGRLSAFFFKKGDTSKFCSTNMTWKDMIPDLLIPLIPVIVGIILLIIKFDFIILSALVLLVLFSTTGNNFIRGSMTCKYCKQRELGCPAEALFNKEK